MEARMIRPPAIPVTICQSQELSGTFSCFFHLIFADNIAKENTSGTGGSEAEHCPEIAHDDDEGIGGYSICPQMADNDGVHGKGRAPCYIIAEGRQGQSDKVGEERFIPYK